MLAVFGIGTTELIILGILVFGGLGFMAFIGLIVFLAVRPRDRR